MSLHKLPLFVWAIFVTAILLLLALPVLAGKFSVVPALNLANCWEPLYKITQSAGNLLDLNLLGIFRDYTPELICCLNLPFVLQDTKKMSKFSYYLAGLIEGDGTIIVPKTERSIKGKLNYPSIQIVFHLKDLPLALLIYKTLGHGYYWFKANNFTFISIYFFILSLFFIFLFKDFSLKLNDCMLAFIPAVIFTNADTEKVSILAKTKGKAGVYCWINHLNGNSYVGSSQNLSKRLAQYYSIFHINKVNMTINKALLKYGYSNFSLEILEYCDPKDTINREQYFIDLLKPKYNVLQIAGSSLGYIHTEDTKLKIKDILKANHPKSKGIEILDLQTDITTSYTSVRQAAEAIKVSRTSLFYHLNLKNQNLNINPYRKRYIIEIKRSYHSYPVNLHIKKDLTLLPINLDRKLISNSVSGLQLNNKKCDQFGYYLAGLIEGGTNSILVPTSERSKKGQLNYPSISMQFNLKDLSLVLLLQKELKGGSILRKKGVNAYIFTINNIEGLILVVHLINGKLRTPKIYAFKNLIDWLNNKKLKLNLKSLELDNSPLMSNSWLSGFIEADGHFSVRTSMGSRNPKLECKFELSQRQNDHNDRNNLYFLENIAMLLLTVVKSIRVESINPQYRIRTTSLKGNITLEKYLNTYPLFGTKYLDYKDWLEVLKFFKLGEHVNKLAIEKIISIKSNMNDKRTVFTWDHLQSFYNLD